MDDARSVGVPVAPGVRTCSLRSGPGIEQATDMEQHPTMIEALLQHRGHHFSINAASAGTCKEPVGGREAEVEAERRHEEGGSQQARRHQPHGRSGLWAPIGSGPNGGNHDDRSIVSSNPRNDDIVDCSSDDSSLLNKSHSTHAHRDVQLADRHRARDDGQGDADLRAVPLATPAAEQGVEAPSKRRPREDVERTCGGGGSGETGTLFAEADAQASDNRTRGAFSDDQREGPMHGPGAVCSHTDASSAVASELQPQKRRRLRGKQMVPRLAPSPLNSMHAGLSSGSLRSATSTSTVHRAAVRHDRNGHELISGDGTASGRQHNGGGAQRWGIDLGLTAWHGRPPDAEKRCVDDRLNG